MLSGCPPATAQPSAPRPPVHSTQYSTKSVPTSAPPCQKPQAKPPSTNSVSAIVNHGIEDFRSEEHTSELQSLMRISYAVFCLKKKKNTINTIYTRHNTQPKSTSHHHMKHRTQTLKSNITDTQHESK